MTSHAVRFVSAALLLASAAIFLQLQPRREALPPRLPLNKFPTEMGTWHGTDIRITKDILEALGPGDFLLRVYRNTDNSQPPGELFIAYLPSQRTGDTIHSPRNCLPGAGWIPIQSSRTVVAARGHAQFPANRYVIARADSRQLVLYWYWAHDRGIASEYLAKFYLVADSIRLHRSDAALIRVTTQMLSGETASAAEQRIVPFASSLVPLLNDYIPR